MGGGIQFNDQLIHKQCKIRMNILNTRTKQTTEIKQFIYNSE